MRGAMRKIEKKQFIRDTGIIAGGLLLGISSLTFMQKYADEIAPKFYETNVKKKRKNVLK